VDAEQLEVPCAHHIGDLRAPIAALRDELRVAQRLIA
jgi:hypothetical protein